MFVSFEGGQRTLGSGEAFPFDPASILALVADFSESRALAQTLFPGPHAQGDASAWAKYESLLGFDHLYFARPALLNQGGDSPAQTEVYISQERIAIFSQDAALRQALIQHISGGEGAPSPAGTLRKLLFCLFLHDGDQLNHIEDGLAELETLVVNNTGRVKNITKELLSTRKTLLTLGRYYSAMFDMLEDLEENPNAIFTAEEIRRFRLHTNKADRLQGEINHLKEYATQVREAYQSQLDIQQNKVMQFFTVITSIFLPPTLIAGWYGMNLAMPESKLPFTYPIAILVSIVSVCGLLVYFKRKKWF